MTVAELIKQLQECPQDYEALIIDADTNWVGPKIHILVDHEDKDVALYIDYDEMER